jgi:Peptidase family M23
MLSEKSFPYTGPLYGPSHTEPASRNRETIKGLKRALIRLGYLEQPLGSETDDFGTELEVAFRKWLMKEHSIKWSYYGRGVWLILRDTKLATGPNQGQWAMDAKALAYVREDALKECYPHPLGAPGTFIGQGLHPTDGIPGNWAIDFMAPGGTKVLAVVNARVTRLSGHPPSEGWHGPGIFGWSIYYETTDGYTFFSTHFGERFVGEGQVIDVGQVIAEVGHWPGDPGRSHTHLGCSSVKGTAAAKAKITSISQAKRVAA